MVSPDAKMQHLLKENCSFPSLLLCVILNNDVTHSVRKRYAVKVMGQEIEDYRQGGRDRK